MEKCFSVRTGCNIFAVLAMMGAVAQVFKDVNVIASHGTPEQQEKELFSLSSICGSVVENFFVEIRNISEIEKDSVETFFKINFCIAFIDVILCMGIIGAAVCILYGVHNEEDKFLLPFIWFLPFDLVVRCVFAFVLIINFGFTSPLSISLANLFIVVIFVQLGPGPKPKIWTKA